MKEIKIFNHEMFGAIRTTTNERGEPLFVGKDVAKALGYKKPENALAVHVDSEDKTTTLIQGTGSNYKTRVVMINEILRRAEDIIGRTLRMLNAPSCNPSHFKAFQSLGTPCFNGVKREIKQSSNQAFTHLLDARKAVSAQGFHYLRNLNL